MLADIEITQLAKPQQNRYKNDRILSLHNTNVNQNQNYLLGSQTSTQESTKKKIVPIKEYSNKFLRQSASKENAKEKSQENNRLNLLVNKHKSFQKKYQKVLSKKQYVCRTEPNETEYQCFKTTKHFYRPSQIEAGRVKTEGMIEKNNSIRIQSQSIDREPSQTKAIQQNFFTYDENEPKTKKVDCFFGTKKDEKISTSRALELFSRIVSKDRNELLDRIRVCNQTKLLKQRLMENSKNLQARQMVLAEKVKKFSVVQKGERKPYSVKRGLKYKAKKQSQAHQMFGDQQNFELTGWDLPY